MGHWSGTYPPAGYDQGMLLHRINRPNLREGEVCLLALVRAYVYDPS